MWRFSLAATKTDGAHVRCHGGEARCAWLRWFGHIQRGTITIWVEERGHEVSWSKRSRDRGYCWMDGLDSRQWPLRGTDKGRKEFLMLDANIQSTYLNPHHFIYLFFTFEVKSHVNVFFTHFDSGSSCSPSSKNHQHNRCPSTYHHNSPVQKKRDTSLVRFFCAVVFCQMTLQQHKKRSKTPKDICVCAAFSDSEDPSIYDRWPS